MSLAKKLFSGSAIRVTHLLLEILVGFLLMPFLISQLTEQWYGLWILVGSITGFFTLLTLGLSSAVQRFLSYEISSQNYTEYRKTISSSLVVFGFAAGLCLLISWVISMSTSYYVEDVELERSFSILILLVGANFSIKFFSTPFVAALTAEFKFVLVSSIEIAGFVIKSLLTVYFVTEGYGVISIGMALLIGEAIANLCIAIIAFTRIKAFQFRLAFVDRAKLLELYKFGLNSFIATLGTMLRFPIGNVVISVFLGLSSVTIYSIPVRLLNYADAFIVTSIGVLQPYFTKLYAEGKTEELKNKFFFANAISFGLGGLLAGGLFVFGVDFIELWVGDYKETRWLTYILPFSLMFGISQHPSIMILYTLGKHKYYAIQNLLEALVNVALGLVLIQWFGIPGVALGVVLPMLVTKVWLLPKYVCKQLETSFRSYFSAMLKVYFFVISYSSFWLYFDIKIKDWMDLILWALVYGGGYFVLYIYFIADRSFRLHFRDLIFVRILKKHKPS
ncbi:MAG: O-antigen/teichoic acid export membrane protein [Alteromonadaceae bacterium]